MRKNIALTICILFVFSISACSGSENSLLPTVLVPALEKNAYPAPGQETGTAYPSPDQTMFSPLTNGILPEAPKEAPDTAPNTASISGVLYTYTIQQVLPQTGFFLIPAVGAEKREVPPIIADPDPSRGEIIGVSDAQGIISVNNIPPGNYYLVIWAPMSWSVAQNSETDVNARLIELKSGDRTPLGIIYTSWP